MPGQAWHDNIAGVNARRDIPGSMPGVTTSRASMPRDDDLGGRPQNGRTPISHACAHSANTTYATTPITTAPTVPPTVPFAYCT